MDDEQKQTEVVEKEKYLRLAADFENYRKRVATESDEAREFGKRVVLEDVIDILDNFELAIRETIKSRGQEDDWAEGLRRALSDFERMLRIYNVKKIETVGRPLDLNLMEPMQTEPPISPEQSGTVESEIRAGYTMHDRVIRTARVIIYQ